MIGVFRAAWLIASKDLRVEARSRELLYSTVFFSVSCVLIFAWAFVRGGVPIADAPSGVLWVAIVFSGTLALGRAFERERQSETIRGLLLAPIERSAVYLGKLIALLILLAIVEAVLVPIVALFFWAPIGRAPWLFAGLLAAGTIGFAAVGTLFAAMLTRVQSRDVLLSMLLFPVTVPVVIAGVQGTAAIFAADANFGLATTCLTLLVFFDAVFITLALWTFAPVMHE